jgi:ring-1,2-phenylacetyl-CoA epoxidase subunit PaaB
MDTQWNQYEVFEKERTDLPYRSAGAVHAPDGELALEYARDVFVRRPNCIGLWLVPAEAVYAKTAQELAGIQRAEPPPLSNECQTFLVFQKQGQVARETYVVHVGQVEAESPARALEQALITFSNENVFVWWVVPAAAVVQSLPEDGPSMFDPAHAKSYRHHLQYPVEETLREQRKSPRKGDA